MKFNGEFTFDDIHRFWLSRAKALDVWLEKKLNIPRNQRVPILVPQKRIALHTNSNIQQLANYLQKEIPSLKHASNIVQNVQSGRFIFVPYQNKEIWNTILIHINADNELTTAYYVNAFATEGVVDTFLKKLGVFFNELTSDKKIVLLNKLAHKLSEDKLIIEDSESVAILKKQFEKVDYNHPKRIAELYGHCSNDKDASAFLCIENAIQLIKMHYKNQYTNDDCFLWPK